MMSRGKIVGGRIRRKFPRRTFCFRIDLIEALDRNEIFEISSCAYLDRDLLLNRSRSGEKEGKTVRFLRVGRCNGLYIRPPFSSTFRTRRKHPSLGPGETLKYETEFEKKILARSSRQLFYNEQCPSMLSVNHRQ